MRFLMLAVSLALLPLPVRAQNEEPLTNFTLPVELVKVPGSLVDYTDMNGDGRKDFVTTSSNSYYAFGKVTTTSRSIYVSHSQVDGSFSQPVKTEIPIDAEHINTGDFNGDGIGDFALSRLEYTYNPDLVYGVGIWHGLANGTFVFDRLIAPTINIYSKAVVDFNEDGRDDLALGRIYSPDSKDKGVLIWLSQPDGSFKQSVELALSINPLGIVKADFNDDKHLDLMVSDVRNSAAVLLSRGNGRDFVTRSLPDGPSGLFLGDFDGDGYPDVASNWTEKISDGITVTLNRGNGFSTPLRSDWHLISCIGCRAEYTGLAAGDYNADGYDDLMFSWNELDGRIDGQLIMFGNDGGSIRVTSRRRLPFGRMIDVDGDGDDDILLSGLKVMYNRGKELDVTPPETTFHSFLSHQWKFGATIWSDNFTVVDSGYGPNITYFAFDDTTCSPDNLASCQIASTKPIDPLSSINTPGDHTLTFFSADRAGNLEAPKKVTLHIRKWSERANPLIEDILVNPGGWNTSTIQFFYMNHQRIIGVDLTLNLVHPENTPDLVPTLFENPSYSWDVTTDPLNPWHVTAAGEPLFEVKLNYMIDVPANAPLYGDYEIEVKSAIVTLEDGSKVDMTKTARNGRVIVTDEWYHQQWYYDYGTGIETAFQIFLTGKLRYGSKLIDPPADLVRKFDVSPKPGTNGRPRGDGKIGADDLNLIMRNTMGLDTAP